MKEDIAEILRDPNVQRYNLNCDECGHELYHSHKGVSQRPDDATSVMKMAILSHKDTASHDSYTLETDVNKVEEIEVELTIEK